MSAIFKNCIMLNEEEKKKNQQSQSRERRYKKKRYRGNEKTVNNARGRLKNFRQASILAVSITGFLLIFFSLSDEDLALQAQQTEDISVEEYQTGAVDSLLQEEKATEEAIGALQRFWDNFMYNGPKILIAIGFLFLAWLLIRLIRYILRKSLDRLQSSKGIITIVMIGLWLLVIGIAVSIIAGDLRALVGSLGLFGLALSWALQTPIESFTGWLLNAFKHYFRPGDRIKVGDVFGDVYKMDFLTTTIWEIGSPYQPGFVNAEQPTGRLVTFPNNEILTGTIINLTRDFPYVWDELVICVANESDIKFTNHVLEKAATDKIGEYMKEPSHRYREILKKAGLPSDLSDKPLLYTSPNDSWTEIIIRYLVGARERRQWKTKLYLHLSAILEKDENKKKIIPVYPRQQVQMISGDGRPLDN